MPDYVLEDENERRLEQALKLFGKGTHQQVVKIQKKGAEAMSDLSTMNTIEKFSKMLLEPGAVRKGKLPTREEALGYLAEYGAAYAKVNKVSVQKGTAQAATACEALYIIGGGEDLSRYYPQVV